MKVIGRLGMLPVEAGPNCFCACAARRSERLKLK